MNVAIGIATTGRREQLSRTLSQIALQRVPPCCVFVCPASLDDFDPDLEVGNGIPLKVVAGVRGLCSQRNAIIAAAADVDVMVFMDDDFYPEARYLERVVEIFEAERDVVIATNHPALDGALGPGVPHQQALEAIAALGPLAERETHFADTYGGYGCNMAVRLAQVRHYEVRFDERLPLYGWLEDIDFSRRLAPYGRIVVAHALRGVHLATKRGRTSGVRLGYSQIANPIYMLRKGNVRATFALKYLLRNLAKNLLRSLRPEPWVDRRGRLKGNLIAVSDLLANRLDPRRILDL